MSFAFLSFLLLKLTTCSGILYTKVVDVWEDGSYLMTYTLNEEFGIITFELDVETTIGWVGIGFSSDGKMLGGDLITAYMDLNKNIPVIEDRFSRKDGRFELDTQLGSTDDLRRISGFIDEQLGRTIFQFTRKLDTGDTYDLEIKKNIEIVLLFSVRDLGNPSTEGALLGHTKSKILPILLYEDLEKKRDELENSKIMILGLESTVVPPEENSKLCQLINIPEKITHDLGVELVEKKYHAIKFEAKFDSQLVSSISIYTCNSKGAELDEFKGCQSKLATSCYHLLTTLDPVKNVVDYPPLAGVVWGTNGVENLILQVNFKNPEKLENVEDKSHVVVYYTKNLRHHDMGFSLFGIKPTTLEIPPNSSSFSLTSSCNTNCQNDFSHTHLVSVSTYGGSRLSNTLLEINYIIGKIDDQTFNNQNNLENENFKILKSQYHINKDDVLSFTCTYDTTGINQIIKGGEEENEELCYAYISYFPKEEILHDCLDSICSNSARIKFIFLSFVVLLVLF